MTGPQPPLPPEEEETQEKQLAFWAFLFRYIIFALCLPLGILFLVIGFVEKDLVLLMLGGASVITGVLYGFMAVRLIRSRGKT